MTVDREQIRRDVESFASDMEATSWTKIVAGYCVALFAELEQAEKERDEARRQRGNFERIAREQAEKAHALWQWRNEHEARLAAVPALVEALKRAQTYVVEWQRLNGRGRQNRDVEIIAQALAAFESDLEPA